MKKTNKIGSRAKFTRKVSTPVKTQGFNAQIPSYPDFTTTSKRWLDERRPVWDFYQDTLDRNMWATMIGLGIGVGIVASVLGMLYFIGL